MKVAKIYYGIHMGASHKTLKNIYKKPVAGGECVLFVNKAMTAAKALYRGGLLLYLRPTSGTMTLNDLVQMATACGGQKLQLTGAGISALERWAAKAGSKAGWLAKVVSA